MAGVEVADDEARGSYPFAIDRTEGPMEVDLRPAVRAAVEDLLSGVSPGDISGRFHNTVATVTVEVAEALLAELGEVPVALTGGVFQNARLVGKIERKLANEVRVLRHREVPPGDGGIALGQALIADAFLGDKG